MPSKMSADKVAPDKSMEIEGDSDINEDEVEAMDVEESAENAPPKGNRLEVITDEDGGIRIGDIYITPPMPALCSATSTDKRLIISRIENIDFKSYRGTVNLGPFFPYFNAIIGPNGSGKSNVIDSILFVFGYRNKKIRCEKLNKLIHKSSQFPNITTCTVNIHFRQIQPNPDGTHTDVPDSDFVIGRTISNNNTSYYTINGRKMLFKYVAKELRKHGIDLDHNRFLILQGEVESIAMMKPKGDTETGLLEYLEDIIGTSRYKEALFEINVLVDKLTEERTEKHNRCKYAEREMKDLEEPMKAAVEFLKLENDKIRSQNKTYQKYLSLGVKKQAACEEQLTSCKQKMDEHTEKYRTMKEERIKKEKIFQEKGSKYNALIKSIEEHKQKYDNMLRKYQEVQAALDGINKRRKVAMKELTKNNEKLEQLKMLPAKNEKDIAECEAKLAKLEAKKSVLDEELQTNLEKLKHQSQPLIEKKTVLEDELIEYKRKVDESKSAQTLVESELRICQQQETTEKRKYESIKLSFEESQTRKNELTESMNEISANLPKLKEQLVEKEESFVKCKQEEQVLNEKVRASQREIAEITNNMQKRRNHGQVLEALMQQKDSGNIPGIMGRLGDLGAIDKKYDVAISTCCPRLEHILVDTVNTAQACIEFLKRQNVGRASFVALEKVSHFGNAAGQNFQSPENAPRLYDLIRVEDERVLAAFYFALRDTLVANDLTQATRIGYGAQRFRVVTLRGEIIETTGTMSGGGRTQTTGRMGQSVATKTSVESHNNSTLSGKNVDTMKMEERQMQDRINYLQEMQGQLQREINGLRNAIKQKEAEISRYAFDMKSLCEQLPRIKEQVQRQKAKADATVADQNRVEVLENDIIKKKKLFEECEADAKKISTKVDAINKQIGKIKSESVNSVNSAIANVVQQIGKLKTHVSKMKAELSTCERNVTKAEQKIESLTTEIKDAEDDIRKGIADRDTYDADSVKLLNITDEKKSELKIAEEGSDDMKKEIAELQKQENEGKVIGLEVEQNFKSAQKQLSEAKAIIPHWNSKIEPLKLTNIPNEPEPEPLKKYTVEELEPYNVDELQYQLSSLEEQLSNKTPNLTIIDEYYVKRTAYLDRVAVFEDITAQRNAMRQVYEDLRKNRYNEFMHGFQVITRKLKEMYQMITQGGDAELELVDSMDPFAEGILFSVRPPKKSWKGISNLSGGEKTLSSLALVFALHYYKPSPLYFMDEIDAALDFRNVSIVANYIRERTKNTQFIIISLRSNMFELSDYLHGIYKVRDCTHTVTIKNVVPEVVRKALMDRKELENASVFDQIKSSQPQAETKEDGSKKSAGANADIDSTSKTGDCEEAMDETLEKTLVDETLFIVAAELKGNSIADGDDELMEEVPSSNNDITDDA